MLRCTLLPLLVGLAPAQDFVDLRWRELDDGRLEVHTGVPPAAAGQIGAAWQTMFPGLFENGSAFGEITHLGVFPILPLLLHGDGGAAAIDEAVHRLRKLDVRLILAQHWFSRHARPDALRDLLYVRYLEQQDPYSATRALISLATAGDERKRDDFVRAAAAAAAVRRLAEARREVEAELVGRNGLAALHSGLQRLPDDAAMVAGMHTATLPTAAGLLRAWRLLLGRLASEAVLNAGGAMSPAENVVPQMQIDQPGQLPYELAARFGNWRVDYALFARRGPESEQWWFHLGGVFRPGQIAAGLRDAQIDAALRDGIVTATAHGWSLRATAATFEAWQGDLGGVGRGRRMNAYHARAESVWARVESSTPLARRLGIGDATLDVVFDPGAGVVEASVDCRDDGAAGAVLAAWQRWRATAAVALDDEVPERPGITWRMIGSAPAGTNERERGELTWRRAVGRIEARRQGARVRLRSDLSACPTLVILGWARPPLADRLRFR